jgi:hypothetical protein
METKTEEVANWFGHAKFTFAQLKLGGASHHEVSKTCNLNPNVNLAVKLDGFRPTCASRDSLGLKIPVLPLI